MSGDEDHSVFNKKRCFNVTQSYNNKENEEPGKSERLESMSCRSTENDQPQSSNNILLQILENQRRMLQILENQRRMQEQIQELQNTVVRLTDPDAISRENLVISRETLKTVKRLFGEGLSKKEEEMGSFLPLSESSEMQALEEELKKKENEDAMKTYLICKKGNQSLDALFRNICSDNLLDQYNWDGRCGKKTLKNFKLFGAILKDVYSNLSSKEYDAQIRKAIELSHNRYKQKRLKDQQSSSRSQF